MAAQIIATIIGGKSEKKAASLESRGAIKAGETAAEGYLQAGEQYQTGVGEVAEGLAPWRNVGQEALYSLADEMGLQIEGREPGAAGGYKDTPYYQEERADILSAMTKSASARGLSQSGGFVEALGERAGRYAASKRESYMDRLAALSGGGYRAATDTATLEEGGLRAQATATQRASESRASSYLTSSQARGRGARGYAESIVSGISGINEQAMFMAGKMMGAG